MSDTPTTNISIPIHVDPRSLTNLATVLDVAGTPGAQAIGAARGALGSLHQAFTDIHAAEVAVRKAAPVIRTDHGRTIQMAVSEDLGKASQAAMKRAWPSIESANKQFDGIAQLLERRVGEAMADSAASTPAGIAIATDIRAFVKSMSVSDRMSFLRQAVNDGDKRTIAAVLSGPAYLSGCDAGQLDLLRDQAAMKFAPQEHAQLNAVRQTKAHVEQAGASLMSRVDKVVKLGVNPVTAATAAIQKLAAGK
jgi:hypothetical protein